MNMYHYNDRLIMIKLKVRSIDLCIMAVYLFTTKSRDEEVYEQVDELINLVKDNDNLIVIGEFNENKSKNDFGW